MGLSLCFLDFIQTKNWKLCAQMYSKKVYPLFQATQGNFITKLNALFHVSDERGKQPTKVSI